MMSNPRKSIHPHLTTYKRVEGVAGVVGSAMDCNSQIIWAKLQTTQFHSSNFVQTLIYA